MPDFPAGSLMLLLDAHFLMKNIRGRTMFGLTSQYARIKSELTPPKASLTLMSLESLLGAWKSLTVADSQPGRMPPCSML